MLNLSAYTASLEDHEDEIPSPLMDYNTEPAIVAPVAEFIEPIEGALPVIEEAVVLPPALDPTPLQPLPETGMQEEIIAENLDAEVGQLMGAQIALEGYSKLLRGAGKNMTRQSAAFMAVGMMRANRIMGVTSLGLESEESGTQVMAMQKANVDEKGLGSKIKDIAAKIWEWIKEKYEQLKGLFEKAKALFNKDKEKAVYLLAASEAVASGNTSKVKALTAPSGLRSSHGLEAAEGEDAGKPTTAKSITLPSTIARYVVAKGKIVLSNTAGQDVLKKYMADSIAMTRAISAAVSQMSSSTTEEEASDIVSDLIKKHMATGAARSHIMGNIYVVRTAEGALEIEGMDGEGAEGEVALPALSEADTYLKSFISGEEPYAAEIKGVYDSGSEFMQNKSFADPHIKQLGNTIVRVFRGSGVNDSITEVMKLITQSHSAAVAACDLIIATHGGGGNSISQEDYIALPSNKAPAGPGLGSRMVAGAKAAWAKVKAFFIRLWEQLRDAVKRAWEKLFGTNKQTEILLLANNYVPEDGQAPTGPAPDLPQGSGLKSVAAIRSLPAPGAAPQMEPEAIVPDVTPEPSAPEAPPGHVFANGAKQLQLGNTWAYDPSIEETYVNWLVRSYNPGLIKMWRDLISYVNGGIDPKQTDQWGKVITDMFSRLMQGAPTGQFPGNIDVSVAPQAPCFSFGRGEIGGETAAVKVIGRRQIDQALSRQKKSLQVLIAAESVFTEHNKLRDQFEATIDRLIKAADDETANQWANLYTIVNRTMGNTAFNQLLRRIKGTFSARVELFDAMIAARAKGKK